MIRSPPGSGKTQLAYDIYRYCNEERKDLTCIFVDATAPVNFNLLTEALLKFYKNPNPDRKLIVIVDELQAQYSKLVNIQSIPFFFLSH